ncbi:MAG: DUF4917 family protein [Ignavibacteria bacterium]|nr:DUF4917 family protein [Ignavibacteria bacterium]
MGGVFADNDRHVLDAILKNQPQLIAVSVLTTQSEADQQAYCHQVLKEIRRITDSTEVVFYDSRSAGCWNN